MAELLNNQWFVVVAMSVIAFAITQGLKWAFVKPFTKNLTQKKKNIINSVILIIAFGVAVACEVAYSHFWLHAPIDFIRAFNGWSGASAVYAVVERIIKSFNKDAKLENPYETEQGKELVDTIKDVTKDNKIDVNDKDVVQKYLDKVN